MKFNKIFKLSLSLLITPVVLATTTLATSCSDQDSLEVVVNKLLQIKDIKKIDVIPNVPGFKHKLILHIEQPIDWTDESKGTFTQRVEFGFNGYNNVNMVNIGGYELTDSYFFKGTNRELIKRYNSNYLNIEYRYFGGSRPNIEWAPKKSSMWKYLTIENAIKDFHHINVILRDVIKGKWIISGGSKGGQTTDTYAMMYPKDADAFVSYVGPKCNLNESTSSPKEDSNDNMMDWVLNDIGNKSTMGEAAAEAQRLEVFKLQNYMLSKTTTNALKDKFVQKFLDENYIFNEYCLSNHAALYYCCVMDMGVGFWQSNRDLEEIKKINAITDETEKQSACYTLLTTDYGPIDYNINDVAYPYEIQGWKEMGIYNLNPQKFIDKTNAYNAKYGSSMPVPTFIGVDSGDYSTLRYKCLYSEDVYNNITLDKTIKNKLDAWTATNEANVIMIFGEKDPWTAYKWSSITSNKIHVYMNKANSHNSIINTLEENDKKECWALLDSWLL